MFVCVCQTAESRCERDSSRKFVFVAGFCGIASDKSTSRFLRSFDRMHMGRWLVCERASESERMSEPFSGSSVFTTPTSGRSDFLFFSVSIEQCVAARVARRRDYGHWIIVYYFIGGDWRLSFAYVQSAMLNHSTASLSSRGGLAVFPRATRVSSKSHISKEHTPTRRTRNAIRFELCWKNSKIVLSTMDSYTHARAL